MEETTVAVRDKYDEAIAYLEKDPGEIHEAWDNPYSHPGGCLFQYASNKHGRYEYGCLTQIRNREINVAPTESLTLAIRSDERIPLFVKDINVANLGVFAEWQRRLDAELGRPV